MSKSSKRSAKYLESIGIREFRNQEKFWAFVEKRRGIEKCQKLDVGFQAISVGDMDSFYEVMYEDLDVSLDVASLRKNLYSIWLDWFMLSFPKVEGTLLDIGCGNGVLTCFYAQEFPEAKVIALDKSQAAINCARLLASRLDLKNVEFVVSNCISETDSLPADSIDIAISMTGLEPGGNVGLARRCDLIEWSNTTGNEIHIPELENIARCLKQSGTFISVDRLRNLEDKFSWASAIQNLGLGIDLLKYDELSFTDQGNSETLPILIARSQSSKVDSRDLLSFLMERQGGIEKLFFGDGNPELAELLFSSINPKQLVSGWKADFYDKSGVAHYEVWQTGALVLLYTWSTLGYRELKVVAAYMLNESLKGVERQLSGLQGSAAVTRYGDTPPKLEIMERADDILAKLKH